MFSPVAADDAVEPPQHPLLHHIPTLRNVRRNSWVYNRRTCQTTKIPEIIQSPHNLDIMRCVNGRRDPHTTENKQKIVKVSLAIFYDTQTCNHKKMFGKYVNKQTSLSLYNRK